MKIIALCGMPGSGKTTVKQLAQKHFGLPSWYIGQPLVDACLSAGLEPTYANRMEAGASLGLFESGDPLKFIKYSTRLMTGRYPNAPALIFDSVRSLPELQFIQSSDQQLALVAVILGRPERHRRLVRRDGLEVSQVEARDCMEIGLTDPFMRALDVGRLIAIADYYILTPSDDARIGSVTAQLGEILKHLGFTPAQRLRNSSPFKSNSVLI